MVTLPFEIVLLLGRKFCHVWVSFFFTKLLAVREFANKSAASAASPDYVKFQAVIKAAASAASLRGGRAGGRLDHGVFFAASWRASAQRIVKKMKEE